MIKELINDLCLGGVEYKKLSEVTSMQRGTSLTKAKAVPGEFPVISGGREPAFYCDTFNREGETITVAGSGAGAGYVQYWNEAIYVNDAFSIKGSEELLTKYIYYYLTSIQEKINDTKTGVGVPHVHISDVENFEIPIAPIEIQKEIIEILDTFVELTKVLSSELEIRKRQYDEIAYRLLIDNNNGEKYLLSDICSLTKGKTAIQKAIPGEYPLVVTTTERKSCNEYQFDGEAVCVPLVSSRGHGVACLNHVYYQEGKFALGNILCAISSMNKELVTTKYLYYYFECTKDYTLVPLMKGGANVSMTIKDISSVKVSIPSIAEQNKIIKKLEIIDEYCTEVLPREIEVRETQYAYYRKMLFDFKRK